MRYINGTRLDDRIIRSDWDAGFTEGRQYGRGKSGGQVRLGWVKVFLHSDSKSNQYYVKLYCCKECLNCIQTAILGVLCPPLLNFQTIHAM